MRVRTILVAATAACISQAAFANIGVPMAVFLPPLWLALIPVIAIEALVLVKLLPVSLRQATKAAAVGNLLSTLAGIPILWMILATLQLVVAGGAMGLQTFPARLFAVTVQAPWLIPYEEDLPWMVPTALAVLALPAYALSVFIEWRTALPQLPRGARAHALRAVAYANLTSYGFLVVVFAVAIWQEAHLRRLFSIFGPMVGWFMESVFSLAKLLHGG